MAEFKNLSESGLQHHSVEHGRFPKSLFVIVVISFLMFVLTIGGSIFLWLSTPDVAWLKTTNPKETAMMRYRAEEGKRLGKPVQRKWQWVGYSHISDNLIRAVIINEDYNFFKFKGFDWEDMWQAFKTNLRNKRTVRGGSGITQQLAKNLFLEPTPSILRKIKEALITYKLERELSKVRILELYLNIIEWGPGIFGAQAAAQAYFKKPAAELSLLEAILLVSVMPNPNRFSPLDNSDHNLNRMRGDIALKLLRRGWINSVAYEQVLQELNNFQQYQNRFKPLELAAPIVVSTPTVSSKLLKPEYWVSKLSEPDKVIMTYEEIGYFNKQVLLMIEGNDIFGLPDFLTKKEVTEKIIEVARLSSTYLPTYYHNNNSGLDDRSPTEMPNEAETKFDRYNNPLTERYYKNLLEKLNLRSIPHEVKISYAMVIRRTDVLAWPVEELIMRNPFDYEFNEIQQSAIYLGTPVAVFHTSRDGRWVFIRTSYFDGWVKKNDIAWTTREEAIVYPGPQFLVVISPSVRTSSRIDLMLGTQVPIIRTTPNGYKIKIPTRGTNGELKLLDDFINPDGVREGFIPYTKRNVITQAFKLLGATYSWGGSKSGWDCSLFIRDVFSVFGIKLPRNSWWQANVSKEIDTFGEETPAREKLDRINLWDPGVSLLRLPGHIMLYLGEDGGKPYAIHAIWGVKDKQSITIKVNKVAVTDLNLGQGGEKGSLLERITDVRGVYLDHADLKGILKSFLKWSTSPPIRLFMVLLAFAFIIILILGLAFIVLLMRLIEERKKQRPKTELPT